MAGPFRTARARLALFAVLAAAALFALPAIASAATISGTVTDAVSGDPIADIAVDTYQYNAVDDVWDWVGDTWTTETGTYVVDVTPGEWRVGFWDSTGSYLDEYYTSDGGVADIIDAQTLTVPTLGLSGINAELESAPDPTADAYEPDDTFATGTDFTVGTPQNRTLFPSGDSDWVTINLLAGKTYILSTGVSPEAPVPSEPDTYLELYEADGTTLIDENDDTEGLFSRIIYTAPSDMTVYLKVRGFDEFATGWYSLNVNTGDFGTISGTLTDAMSGEPIWGAVAQPLYEDPMEPGSWLWTNLGGDTDDTGYYSVPLEAGTYRLLFTDWQTMYYDEYYDGVADVVDALDITVIAGEDYVANADLVPFPVGGGGIAGHVSGGAMAADVFECEVVAGHVETDEWGDSFVWDGNAYTDEFGDYAIEQLWAGDYLVYFGSTDLFLGEWYNNAAGPGYWEGLPPATADPVTVAEDATTLEINANLAAAGRISGTVTGPGGIPVSDGSVTVYKNVDGEWMPFNGAPLEANGTYSIGGMETGSYKVGFTGWDADGRKYAVEYYNDKPVLELSAPVAVTAGQIKSGINAQLAAGGEFSGNVGFDTPNLPESVRVEMWLNTGATGWYVVDSGYARIETDYTYQRAGLPAGSYRLSFTDEYDGFYPPIWFDTKASFSSADTTALAGGQDKVVDQQLDSLGPNTDSDAVASYDGDAEITITATDDGVGVASITYSLDGMAEITAAGGSVTVTVPEDGEHNLSWWATDKLGNVGGESAADFVVTGGSGYTTAVTPIQGDTRVQTAVKSSQAAFPGGITSPWDTVVIATAYNWPDALGGTALAGALDGPILLTDPAALPGDVAEEIVRLGASKAIILGGTGAVNASVEIALKQLLGSTNVERIAGDTRYLTADKVAQRTIDTMQDNGGWDGRILVATGGNFPDALAVAPLAAKQGWPLVLCSPTSGLSTGTKTVMAQANWVYVLGGEGAVSKAVMDGLLATWGHQVERIAGIDRYDTAAVIAQMGVDNCGLSWDKVAFTTGTNFPDALAGGVLQGKSNSVMLLTPTNSLAPSASAKITANADTINEVRFLGGTGAVSQSVRDAIVLLLAQ